ncbi:MAG: hypothetical protein M4579_007400, partial [Chaenotheca gracillima]
MSAQFAQLSTDVPPSAALHPRRASHLSVCLRPSPQNQGQSPAQRWPSTDGPRSHLDVPKIQAPLAAERVGDSNAERWFQDSNSNVQGIPSASFVDNDPPFYIQDKSPFIHATGPAVEPFLRPGLSRTQSGESSNEEFRSVIDDLTIENQRLKRRLRKFEKLHCGHLQREKLFEVRIHGLPPHKKRQLEATLQDFASSLDDEDNATPDATAPPVSHSVGPLSLEKLNAHHASSSATSESRVNDSAYASMSLSGRKSALGGKTKPKPKDPTGRKESKVHSYLHDIPAGLLPRHSLVMTEEHKKKLVVRKMEQLFTGKAPALGEHNHSMQQQEVSNSAALADRSVFEASGRKVNAEGRREARIMPADDNDTNFDPSEPQTSGTGVPPTLRRETTNDSMSRSGVASSSGVSSPDQRPTRPLDLDPEREQFSMENMNYIRHLGMPMPNPAQRLASGDPDGWVYLNLLANMAQLHTINVTPEFVKQAVIGYSDKLEMSRDGRKVRWKGGRSGTKLSSDSSANDSQSSPEETSSGPDAGVKRTKTQQGMKSSTNSSGLPDSNKKRRVLLGQTKPENKFQYKPLFFHSMGSDEEDDFYLDNSDSLMSSKVVEDVRTNGQSSSGLNLTGTTKSPNASSRRRRDDGPIIFYNRAKFCTDLSGDRSLEPREENDPSGYARFTSDVVGYEPSPAKEAKGQSMIDRPLLSTNFDDEMDVDDLDESTSLKISSDSGLPQSQSTPSQAPEFEASGLG